MADIKLWGATFPDVPKVLLPTATDGQAEFYEVSGSQSITENGTYDVSSNASVTVNVEGGGGGGVSEVDAGVMFYDYDGTLLYSYPTDEVATLDVLPANPSHTGLTAQGWNWTLAEIKSYLTSYPEAVVNVGQLYTTFDGKTRIYISIPYDVTGETYEMHFRFGQSHAQGVITVDWGDGTVETFTGMSVMTRNHTYSTYGEYVIAMSTTVGRIQFNGSSSSVGGLIGSATSWYYLRKVIKKIELVDVTVGAYAFQYLESLETITVSESTMNALAQYSFRGDLSLKSITLPSTTVLFDLYALSGCESLKAVSLPNTITEFGNYSMYQCYHLKSVTIPSVTTTFGTYAFRYNISFKKIVVPDSVTKIGNYFVGNTGVETIILSSALTDIGTYAFTNCYLLNTLICNSETPPTVAGSNTFPTNMTAMIYVPYSADHSILEAYQTATNWSTYASRMVELPEQ